jgi:hypothetical protein
MKPTVKKLENGNYLFGGTLEIEPPPDRRPAPLPPLRGRTKDGVDVLVFASGLVVERMETPHEAREELNRRALKRCGGRLAEYKAAWDTELALDEHLKNIAAR